MIITSLQQLFTRDLNRLKTEITSYTTEKNLWLTDGAITNSAGNLCLHLIGNLNSYIGAEIGKTGYLRDRPAEFSLKDIPTTELVQRIEATIQVVQQSLSLLSPEQLNDEYPLLVFAEKITTELFLLHLAGHLNYHLGQINYHRRLLDR